MTAGSDRADGVLRRTLLRASAVAGGAFAVGAPAAVASERAESGEDGSDDEYGEGENGTDEERGENGTDEKRNGEDGEVDEPEGFDVEVTAEHAPFPDDVTATFEVTYPDADEPFVVDLEDASTVILAEVTWDEGARSGWHRHPGMSIVRMIEGEIEHTMEDECISRTYSAGDSWIDPGLVHKADSENGAFAHVTFLGIPDGEPATEWVTPREC